MANRLLLRSPCALALVLVGLLAAGTSNAQIATYLGLRAMSDTPIAVDVAPDGSYWTTNVSNQVEKFSSTGASLVTLGDPNGFLGSGVGQFAGALGAITEPDGNVVVGDPGNLRFQVFSTSGQYRSQFPVAWVFDSGSYALPPEAEGDGNIVYGIYSSRGMAFLRTNESGANLGGWAVRSPIGTAFTIRNGVVYAALDATGGIYKYGLDGTPLGRIQTNLGGFVIALAVTQSGDIIVLNNFSNSLAVFFLAPNGTRLGVIDNVVQLGNAHDIALTPDDSQLYVATQAGIQGGLAVYQLNAAVPTVGTTWGHLKALYR